MHITNISKKSFRSKLAKALFFTNFILITLIVIIYGVYIWNRGIEQREQYYVETVQGIKAQLDEVLNEMDVIACQVATSEDIQKILEKAGSREYAGKNFFSSNLEEKKRAQMILWLFNSPIKRVHSINILSENSLLGLNAWVDTIRIDEDYSEENWQIKEKSYKVWAPHVDKWAKKEQDVVFSLIRQVTGLRAPFKPLGYVEVQQTCSMIETICHADDLKRQILIVDENGTVLFPYGAEEDYRTLLEKEQEGKIFHYRNEKQESKMGVYTPLENVSWNVLLLQDQKVLFEEMRGVLFLSLGIYAILLISVAIIVMAASKWIYKPIRMLSKEAESVTLEDLSGLENLQIEETEFLILKNGFIKMTQQLRESAWKLAAANESELRMKIEQLQAKINPHFLYNSLAAIGAAGTDAGSEAVENMCFQLSELFRYTSEDDPEIVTIQEEMNHVKMYLSFMKYRYEDAFYYDCLEDGDLKTISLCRLAFQPIIENCFRHGFQAVMQPFRIRVECTSKQNNWSFIVEDNGCGFTEDVLDKIRTKIKQIDDIFASGTHYQMLYADNMALVNVYIRLKFLYRDHVEMQIGNDSCLGGAKVLIRGDGKTLNET